MGTRAQKISDAKKNVIKTYTAWWNLHEVNNDYDTVKRTPAYHAKNKKLFIAMVKAKLAYFNLAKVVA